MWRGSIEDLLACRSESDWEGWLARAAELWDPDIEWDVSAYGDVPDIGGVYCGIEAVRQFWREWLAAWETLEFEYELIDAGDRVVALIDQRMRGTLHRYRSAFRKVRASGHVEGWGDDPLEALPQPVGSPRSRRIVGGRSEFPLNWPLSLRAKAGNECCEGGPRRPGRSRRDRLERVF